MQGINEGDMSGGGVDVWIGGGVCVCVCVCVSKGGCSAATCATFGFRSPFFLWKLSCVFQLNV